MAPCESRTFIGSQCELDEGHTGKHMRTFIHGGNYFWTDQAEQEVADRWEARKRSVEPGS